MVMASESGHIEIVRHLIKHGIKDFEGPDGLNALTLAIGQLDSDLVSVLANPEVQPKMLEFLCDIIDELDREISGEKSDSKRNKMESVRSLIVEQKVHERFCGKPSCTKKSACLADQR